MSDSDPQVQYDDAMLDYTMGDFDAALARLEPLVAADAANFEAQMAVAMCHYRKGDFARAILEGHKAERLRPNEQLVHTNLSLFYMRAGDKTTAEKHGLQARIASWKQDMTAPGTSPAPAEGEPELQMAQPKPKAFKLPEKFPDMPWKKNTKLGTPPGGTSTSAPATPSADSPTEPPQAT